MRHVRSLTEIPLEIHTDIFLRLPVKSILCCKCVCKPFLIIIQTPDFIHAHLARVTTSHSPHSLILQYGRSHDKPYGRFHHSLLSIDATTKQVISSSTLTPPIPTAIELDHFYIVGTANGLICLALWFTVTWPDLLFLLWNPCTGHCRYLPKCCYSCSPSVLDFAYVPQTKDYVIVKFESMGTRFQVYKMSMDCWISIACNVSVGVELVFDLEVYEDVNAMCLDGFKSKVLDGNSVFLNGAFHWAFPVHHHCHYDIGNYIVYFNVEDKELGVMKGLDNDRVFVGMEYERGSIQWKLSVIQDSLAVIYHYADHVNTFEIWLMGDYGAVESWALRFRFCDLIADVFPMGYLVNGLMITQEIGGALHLFDLNTGEMKEIPLMETPMGISGFCSFMETLVPVGKA